MHHECLTYYSCRTHMYITLCCSLALHSQFGYGGYFFFFFPNARNDGNSVYGNVVYDPESILATRAGWRPSMIAINKHSHSTPFSHELLFWFRCFFFFHYYFAIETNDEWKLPRTKVNFWMCARRGLTLHFHIYVGYIYLYSIFVNVIYQEFDSVVKSKSKWTIVEIDMQSQYCVWKIFLRCDVECKAVGRSIVRSAANFTAFCSVDFFFCFLFRPLSLSLPIHFHAFLCQVWFDSFKTVIIITLSYPAYARADKQKYSSLFFIMFDK